MQCVEPFNRVFDRSRINNGTSQNLSGRTVRIGLGIIVALFVLSLPLAAFKELHNAGDGKHTGTSTDLRHPIRYRSSIRYGQRGGSDEARARRHRQRL